MSALRWALGGDADIIGDRQFQVLLLANIIAPLGTALLSPVLDSLIDPFGASAANIGLMISALTAPAIFMFPVAGVLADRVGRRPVLLFGLISFGVGGTAIALTTDFQVALGLRLLQGVGYAANASVIITSLGDIYDGPREATAQGLRFTGSGIVQSLAPLAAGLLVVTAWQYPFLVYALSFPIAAVVFVWFEEPATATKGTETDRTLREQIGQLWALVSQPKAASMVIARGTPGIVWVGFLAYNSIHVRNVLGGSPAEAGLLAALGSVSYAISATQAGRITALYDSRVVPMLVLNGALAGGIAVVFLAPSLPVAYAGMVLSGLGLGSLMSIYRSIITGLAPTSLRGGLVSLGEGFGRLAVTIAPIAMGAGIAIGTPRLGFATSIQVVGVGTGVVAASVGVAGILVAQASPPITPPAD